MTKRKIKRRMGLALLIVLIAATSVLATGLNVYFGADSIKDRANKTLDAGNYHNYKASLEFFHNIDPANPTASAGRMAEADIQPLYTSNGGIHKYGLGELPGGTLYVRVWKDVPAGNRKGNYYGVYSNPVAAGATPAYDWPQTVNQVVSMVTDHKADVPYQPQIGKIAESMERDGANLKLKLVIPVEYDPSGSTGGDGIRTAQDLKVLITFPDNHTETKAAPAILTDTPTGKYKFKPFATNWYNPDPGTEGPELTYTTLGVTSGGPDTAVYNFVKQQGGLGVNILPIAYTSISNPAIANVKQLVEAINAAAKEPVVTVIGWWDTKTMKPQGYAVETDPVTKQITGYDPSKDCPPDPKDADLKKDMVYQVSVLKSVDFSLTGVR